MQYVPECRMSIIRKTDSIKLSFTKHPERTDLQP